MPTGHAPLEHKAPLNFDLSLSPEAGRFQARVLDSPFGQVSGPVDELPAPLDLRNRPTAASVQDFGTRLFAAVFRGEILGLLRRSMDEAARQESVLHLRLRLGNVPALASLAWETLYDPANGFLALLNEVSLIRYIEVPQPNRSLTVALPLHVLVVIASPDDYPPLDTEKEWQALREALQGPLAEGMVSLDRLDEATPARLQQQLQRAVYHAFHFIGHGGFDEQTQEGLLIFEDEANHGRALSGQALCTLLGGERRSLVLAVLNACEGARSGHDPFSGVAQGLVRLGIPAVIANQAPLSDRASEALAREFYRGLSTGLPVDVALAEGRKAIYAGGDEVGWGVPALFLRSASDGQIFQPQLLDVTKVITTLQDALPAGDPTPRHLVDTLARFQDFHNRLYEWKELHNYLNDITMILDQFEREVERLDASGSRGDPRALARLWRPVAQKIDFLLAWATTIRYIDAPLEHSERGLKGPAWATEVHGVRVRLEELLHPNDFDLTALYDATYDFSDTAQRHLYLADKALRDTAGELYNLSSLVIGSSKK
ncbi:MAG: CHAT domain-containing protein [Chloroflexota bacterium]